jgi:hypothetical protein
MKEKIQNALKDLNPASKLHEITSCEFDTAGKISEALKLAGYLESSRHVINDLSFWELTVSELQNFLTYEDDEKQMTTEEIYTEIMNSEVFRLNGNEIDLTEKLIALADAIKDEQETDWYLGEDTEACLSELIIGAFWSLTENSGGQTNATYRALCALGDIYFPKMSRSPNENDSSFTAYDTINAYYANK